MKDPKKLAFLTIAFWSFGSYLARLMAVKSQFLLVTISYIFTLLVFLIYCVSVYKNLFFDKVKRNIKKGFLVGPFGYFIYSAALMQSYRAFDNASETTILNYTWLIFTVIFSDLFFRKDCRTSRILRLIEAFGIALGFMSIVILATQGRITSLDSLNIKGLAWGSLAGISYGFFSAFSSTVDQEDQSAFLFTSILASTLWMGIFSIQEIDLISGITLNDLTIVAVRGCFLNGAGYITWTSANRIAREKGVSISSIASLMFLLPLLSLIIIAILLKENSLLKKYFLVSLVLIILSGYISQRSETIADLIEKK
jgi:drug/metabolite transporter (DMT)-like permease